jgi:beta-lactam-binding protein with PASTA domain
MLEAAGLIVAVSFDPVTDPSQDGIVLSEEPRAGSDATAGEVVIIHVGQLSGAPSGDGTATTTTTQ